MLFSDAEVLQELGEELNHLHEIGNGYDSLSGFNDAFRSMIGASPTSAKNSTVVHVTHIATPLGPMLAGATEDALCLLEFTDRRILDDQIQKTIRQFMQVGATVGHAEHSGDLRRFIEQGKKIIVSTVQKFPFILDEIATEGGKTFAISSTRRTTARAAKPRQR